jgi:glycosyltransferase involved in cell wall biosynthesis
MEVSKSVGRTPQGTDLEKLPSGSRFSPDLCLPDCPRLTVGMPVYNADRFLAKALDSFLGQTFKDFELLISDNASTDRTEEICREYAARDHRIRYFRNTQNMGAGWNFRRVHSLANGKYYKYAANDDFIEPTFLEECIAALEADPGLVVAHARTKVVSPAGDLVEYYNFPLRFDSPDPLVRWRDLLLNDHMCFQIFGVFRLDALRQCPPFGSYVNADGVLLAQVGLIGRFWESDKFLFINTRHENQSSQTIPVRLKSQGFRLTRRYGTLPCVEWWDPSKTHDVNFPEFRQFYEYAASVNRATLSPLQKVRAYVLLLPWTKKHFRRMMKDLLIAADQILFNYQNRRGSRRPETKSRAAQVKSDVELTAKSSRR